MIYWSPTARGFYLPGNEPADALAITLEAHAALMAAQEAGQAIVSGPDGRPVAQDPPPPSAEAVAAAARRRRDAALAATDWLVTRHRDQRDGAGPTTLTEAHFAELLAWRQAMRDFPAEGSFPDAPPAAPAWLDGAG